MRERAFDPRRLDVAAFAREGGRLQGRWPLESLARLAASALPGGDAASTDVSWSAAGSLRPQAGTPGQIWLHIVGEARLTLQCQRCLQALQRPIAIDSQMRFVPGEDEAARLDAQTDEDVLALTRELDLQALLEDELLLALPLVPRHEQCPQPLLAPEGGSAELVQQDHPFAALAGLRKRSC